MFFSLAGVIVLKSVARALLLSTPRPFFRHRAFWESAIYLIVLATAIAWGAFLAATLLLYGYSSDISLLIFVGTFGAITGAVTAYSPHLALLTAYLLAMLGPVVETDLYLGGQLGRWRAALTVGVLGFLLLQGKTLNLMYRKRAASFRLAVARRRALGERAQERTAELSLAKELAESAARTAEAANREKSNFLANMSHEIRTPMHGVLGMTELAMANENSTDTNECLKDIKTSAEGLLQVINDILDFSRLEAHKVCLEWQPFLIKECLDHSVCLLRLKAAEKSLPIHISIDPALPVSITGDRLRLQQIITNLLHNAIKFTERGHIFISASPEQTPDGPAVHIAVADTGCGIPEEKRGQIFQAFSQADNSTTRKFGGTGLGLSICLQLAQLMGGQLWVESSAAGSTFHFMVLTEVTANPMDQSLSARA